MELSERIKALIDSIPSILKEAGMKIPRDINALIQSNTNPGTFGRDPMNATWNTTQKINNYKTLVQSFQQGKAHTLTKVDSSNDGLNIKIGTDLIYAGVQEHGMVIKSKGKMHKYFWAMYFESQMKNNFFKIMALSVMKKGFITVPARAYFNPSLTEWQTKRASKYMEGILIKLLELL